MRDLAILFLHVITTALRLLRPGGARSIIAESLLVKQQLLIINRSRQRGSNLRTLDRIIAGLCAILMRPHRVVRTAIILRPSTILSFHRSLVKRKYRILFSPLRRGKPGPRCPSKELINAIVAMKQRNPSWGCPLTLRIEGLIKPRLGCAFPVTVQLSVTNDYPSFCIPHTVLRLLRVGKPLDVAAIISFWNGTRRPVGRVMPLGNVSSSALP